MCEVYSHAHLMGVEAESKNAKDEEGHQMKNGAIDKTQEKIHVTVKFANIG